MISEADQTAGRWTLGLDIGSASIGWAALDISGRRLLAAGVRIFEAGVNDAKFEKGEPGASNNTERRAQRLMRRQLRRRAARKRSLFLLLQGQGLLPATPSHLQGEGCASSVASPIARHLVLDRLDTALGERWTVDSELRRLAAPAQVLPYFLRARALDFPLAPEELGRVLYHLAQRRGFKSNRADAASQSAEKKQKDADERSVVKRGIGELEAAIVQAGARTLGEYFAHLDPADDQTRIRRRWTSRALFEAEFEAIWAAQAQHHGVLTPGLKKRIRYLLYFQRPIAKGSPGRCELEPEQPRAARASWAAQRFRLLQKVNDLRVIGKNFEERPLTAKERADLVAVLEFEGDLTFGSIKKRKLVDLAQGSRFNMEAGGENKIPGNRTVAKLSAALGDEMRRFDAEQRDALVELWCDGTLADEKVAELAHSRFRLSPEAAVRLSVAEPEAGYANLSLRAIRNLLPAMEEGAAFKQAERERYGTAFSGGEVCDRLRPVKESLPTLANPAVTRSLSELRLIVNALIREYGKPYEIRLELARDLKRNARQRAQLSQAMRDRGRQRISAAKLATAEIGIELPKGKEIEVVLLWQQSCGICPYCGQPISLQQAFEAQAAEVDHILPRSRFPDDSFGNKVLAHYRCNQEKRGRTPFEAFGHDRELWDQILARVRGWGDKAKLDAFSVASPEDLDASRENSFAARRLTDTRYATSQAARYLGELFGGRDEQQADGSKRRAIFASSGLATATLRRAWCLERVLAPVTGGKNRGDHRHHAVDAVVIGLTSNAAVQHMAAAAASDLSGRARVTSRALESPWPDFVESVRSVILAIQVSHRPNHRLRGQLHLDTNYSRPRGAETGEDTFLRKAVHCLSAAQIEKIVDPTVRALVRAKVAAVGDAKKLERDPPLLVTRRGARVPVRRARLRVGPASGLTAVGGRWVEERNNHHMELFSGSDAGGKERWRYRIVTRLDAARSQARCRCLPGQRCECVVNRTWDGEGDCEFLFSLMPGDMVRMDSPEGGPAQIYVLRSISANDFWFMRHSLAGRVAELKAADQLQRVKSLRVLQLRRCSKVVVDVLGRIHEARG